MKRSRVSSILGTISLGLIISSCILSPYPTSIAVIPIGIFFSVFLIGGIICAFFEVQISSGDRDKPYKPLAHFFFPSFGLSCFVISLASASLSKYPLGLITEILWFSSAVFGILAAIVYHDDKEKLPEGSRTFISQPDRYETRGIPGRYGTRGMYDATFKIVLFGEPEVDKTALTQRFLTNLFVSDSKMTIGVDFEVKSVVVGSKKVKLQIWDFEGAKRFRFLLPIYVRGAKGGLFLYDASNKSSLSSIDEWLAVIRREIRAEEEFPIIAVGIISDKVNNRQISTEEGMKIAKSRGLDGFIECSVETGENVEEAFEALARLMIDA